jgi:hypothetical protein
MPRTNRLSRCRPCDRTSRRRQAMASTCRFGAEQILHASSNCAQNTTPFPNSDAEHSAHFTRIFCKRDTIAHASFTVRWCVRSINWCRVRISAKIKHFWQKKLKIEPFFKFVTICQLRTPASFDDDKSFASTLSKEIFVLWSGIEIRRQIFSPKFRFSWPSAEHVSEDLQISKQKIAPKIEILHKPRSVTCIRTERNPAKIRISHWIPLNHQSTFTLRVHSTVVSHLRFCYFWCYIFERCICAHIFARAQNRRNFLKRKLKYFSFEKCRQMSDNFRWFLMNKRKHSRRMQKENAQTRSNIQAIQLCNDRRNGYIDGRLPRVQGFIFWIFFGFF